MNRYSLGGCAVEIDEAATQRWYRRAPLWDCACGHCRNFMALARAGRLPEKIMKLLNRLDLPPEKATYVCEAYHERNELFYQVGYRLAGVILERRETALPEDGTQIRCGLERCVPFEAPDFPEPSFELDLWMKLPWVLDEPIGGGEENI